MENQVVFHNESTGNEENIKEGVDNLQVALVIPDQDPLPTPPPGDCDPGVNLSGPAPWTSRDPDLGR